MATAAQRKKARELRRIGMSLRQIAADAGVHMETVRRWTGDIPIPEQRGKITLEIELDILDMRRDGMSYPAIGIEIKRAHGVSIGADAIGKKCRRAGLGGHVTVFSGSDLARFKRALRYKTVKQAAKDWGISAGTAKRVRHEAIKKGSTPRRPTYSEETRARCVRIADRCGSPMRASRMIRAVAGRGPSAKSIHNWRSGRGL